jgi:purine-binding chemotaxis protein CheW
MTALAFQASGTDSYILCEVAGATYALRSDDIELLEMVGPMTPVPNSAGFIDGVTSVRGRVIPVVSMRARFGFERVAHDLRSRLIVVRSQGRSVGFVVDNAREFASIPADAIQPPPDGLEEQSTQYLAGVAHQGERLVFVLDVPELLRVSDVPSIANVRAGDLPAT